MPPTTALHTIGFYCGRHGSGFFDEPQNSFSNVAFLLGAMFAYRLWRKSVEPDKFLLLVVVLLSCIGVGSFLFHSYPTPVTLYVDLVPIQVYVLAILAYSLRRVLECSWKTTVGVLVAFFLVRQVWVLLVPRGLGGGVTHVPTLLLLLLFVVVLARRGLDVWKYLVAGAACYSGALIARSWDVPLCESLPLGLHWVWHLTTALAATLVLVGLIRSREQVRGELPRQL